jgi:hypothetical protein
MSPLYLEEKVVVSSKEVNDSELINVWNSRIFFYKDIDRFAPVLNGYSI